MKIFQEGNINFLMQMAPMGGLFAHEQFKIILLLRRIKANERQKSYCDCDKNSHGRLTLLNLFKSKTKMAIFSVVPSTAKMSAHLFLCAIPPSRPRHCFSDSSSFLYQLPA